MGLFDKKYCDFCGGKIGLLGNRKLEDGNMCKECASKLSPWFSERRHSTKAEIHQKFIVTSASNLEKANPDVLDFSQAAGCSLEIKESRTELKTKDKEGHFISYNPPRYEYSYNFFAKIDVNSPYFDDINYSISNGYIKVGERPMTGVQSNWRVTSSFVGINNENKYYENLNLGNEIKEAVDYMQRTARGEAAAGGAGAASSQPAQEQPQRGPVTCPYCGAATTPDANGCCEYCGSKLV